MVAVFVLVLVNHCEHSTITWIKERDDEANLHAPGPASQPQRRKMAQHISWLFRSWTDMDSFRLGVGQNYVDVVSHCRFQADDFLPNICTWIDWFDSDLDANMFSKRTICGAKRNGLENYLTNLFFGIFWLSLVDMPCNLVQQWFRSCMWNWQVSKNLRQLQDLSLSCTTAGKKLHNSSWFLARIIEYYEHYKCRTHAGYNLLLL